MNQTIKINLGGLVYHINDDAFQRLKAYLDSISNHFANIDEGKEIIEDIEARMAELFQPKINDYKQAILLEDVEEVIGIMGNPEEFEEFSEQSENEEKIPESKSKNKRLYRDAENKILGGVCAGISAYLHIDPIILRIIFVILIIVPGRIGAIIYILLWIVIPKALTRSQKLEMRGENINISNIEKSIKDEYENVKGTLKNIKNTRTYEKTKEVSSEILNVLAVILKTSLKIILGILGISLILGGIATLAGFFSTIAFHEAVQFHFFKFPSIQFPHLYNFYIEVQESPLLLISLLLSITIPLVALIYGGIKLIFRFKANDRLIGVSAFSLWIVSIVILFSLLFFEGKNYAINGKYSSSYIIDPSTSNTLYLNMNSSKRDFEFDEEIDESNDFFGIIFDNNERTFYGKPTLTIEQTEGDDISISIEKRSNGKNKKYAVRNAKKITYDWSQKDSILLFDPYFSVTKTKTWKIPKVKITISLPVNKSVYLSKDMIQVIYDIDNVSNTWDEEMVGKKWIMKKNGLTLLKIK